MSSDLQAVMDTPMPTDVKKMQRFLGVGIFFSEFIPDYATKSAKLYDMTKPTFNWNPSTWKDDYVAEFENLKLRGTSPTGTYLGFSE